MHRVLECHGDTVRVAQPSDPLDVVAEREAWRQHFQAIQAGAGAVPEHVWDSIPVEPTADWLGVLPTSEQVERCIGQLKNRKAAGEDGFMAEFLKYGGPQVFQRVVTIVQTAWRAAVDSDNGLEAVDWPAAWKAGLVVPPLETERVQGGWLKK